MTATQARPTYRLIFRASDRKQWQVQRLHDRHRGDGAWYATEKAFTTQSAANKYLKSRGA